MPPQPNGGKVTPTLAMDAEGTPSRTSSSPPPTSPSTTSTTSTSTSGAARTWRGRCSSSRWVLLPCGVVVGARSRGPSSSS